jgi:transcriptional regulator
MSRANCQGMKRMTDLFERFNPADVRDLIAEYPLAWLLGGAGRADEAAQLPLLGEYGEDGQLASLLGHIPRRHPLVPALQEKPAALVLFQGPQAYVSPDQAGIRNWAPTWNFAFLSIEVELEFLPGETGAALATLVRAMEAGRPEPWDAGELGERYEALEGRVIAFRAHVKRLVGRFKLGQDERPDVRKSIIRSLDDTPLASWMGRFDREDGVS